MEGEEDEKEERGDGETVETRAYEEGGRRRDERETLVWIRTLDRNSVRDRERGDTPFSSRRK